MEADRMGMMLMAAAGYHPQHAIDFYEKHTSSERDFMSTHPSGKERGENLRNLKVWRKAEALYDQVQASQQSKHQS